MEAVIFDELLPGAEAMEASATGENKTRRKFECPGAEVEAARENNRAGSEQIETGLTVTLAW